MMMKASPTAPFVVAESDLLLQFLVIALDPPAQFGQIDQAFEGDLLGKVGEPVLCRLGFTFRPFDQQPFFRPAFRQLVIRKRHRTGTLPLLALVGEIGIERPLGMSADAKCQPSYQT